MKRFTAKTFDQASKEIIKGENIRAALVKYLIDDYRDMEINEIKELISDLLPVEDLTIPGRKVVYDVLFTVKLPNSKDEVGVYIDVEPQGYNEKDNRLVDRALYYCCRLIDRQLTQEKSDFKKGKYGNIKKVYSIWINTADKQRRGQMSVISLNENNDDKEKMFDKKVYDKLTMIFIYPTIDYQKSENEIISLLSLLFSISVDTNEKVNVLESKYEINVSEKEKEAMFGFLDKNEEENEAKFEARIAEAVEIRVAEALKTWIAKEGEARLAKEVEARLAKEVEARLAKEVEARLAKEVETRVAKEMESRVAREVETRVAKEVEARVAEEVEARVTEERTMHNLNIVESIMKNNNMSLEEAFNIIHLSDEEREKVKKLF